MDKIDIILDSKDSSFVDKLMEAIGVKESESISIVFPQFERTDDIIINYFPQTEREYQALQLYSTEVLKKMGCQKWENTFDNEELRELKTIWLFPVEWYNFIPEDLEVVDIFGKKETFKKGVTDDDKRCGALSFGFLKDFSRD